MVSRRVWAVLLGLAMATVAWGPPATAATTVTLSAHITNTDGLDQAGSVCLEPAGPPSSCGGTNIGANGLWSRTWDVDANPGSYLIRVTSSTMDGQSRWYVAGDSAGTTDRNSATAVNLGPGAVDLDFAMVMPAIATVTGTVEDNLGNPVSGATVFRNQLGQSKSAVTDANGHYDFGYVRSGVHSLSVNPVGDYAGTTGSMTVPSTGVYVAPLLTVQKAAAIHGLVTDSVTGDPLPLVQVEVYTAGSHAYQGSAYTGLDGSYRINQLGNQPLVARFTDEFGGYQRRLYVAGDPNDWSGEVSFTLAAEEDKAVDIAMTATTPAVPTHSLSGTVTDGSGHPLPGILVTSPTDPNLNDVTDRLGHWYLDAPAGAYRLRFADDFHWTADVFGSQPGWFPEYYPDASSATAGVPVTAPQANLDVSLTRGAFIRGSLVDPGNPAGTNMSTHWMVYGPSGQLDHEQEYAGFFSGASYTAFVRPGTWRILLRGQHVSPATVDYLPRWFGDVDSFADSTPVTVASGDVLTGKDITVGTTFGGVAAPVVTGTRAVGRVLTASTGTWTTMTLTQFAVTWWRGTTQVGSGASYTVKPGDAGGSLRARVVATNASHTATAYSTASAIPRLASTVTGRGTSPKHGKVRLTITVSATGLTPTGTVTVKRGAKVVKRGVALVGGRAVIVLKRQPSGSRRYTVSYGGSVQTLTSTGSVKVRVR